MTVLVTGGAGFIGSHLTHALVARGTRVRVLDNLSTGHLSNVAPLLDRIEFVEGDLRDPEAVRRAVRGCQAVFHQAALPSVPRSVADPVTTHMVNANGTLNVLQAAREEGVQRLVYASSSSAYGDSPELPKHEEMPSRPMSPYAVSKQCGEAYCRVFHRVYGMETVCLRYFNVFGPRQDPENPYAAVISKFIEALRTGKRPVIYGDGSQSRDFTYVDNVVQANLRAMEAGPQAVGGVFNVACGQAHTLLDLLNLLQELLEVRADPVFAEARPGDVKHSLASLERSRRLLGYSPTVDFRSGLAETVRWFLAEKTPAA